MVSDPAFSQRNWLRALAFSRNGADIIGDPGQESGTALMHVMIASVLFTSPVLLIFNKPGLRKRRVWIGVKSTTGFGP
jgi:hypothetical protein